MLPLVPMFQHLVVPALLGAGLLALSDAPSLSRGVALGLRCAVIGALLGHAGVLAWMRGAA